MFEQSFPINRLVGIEVHSIVGSEIEDCGFALS
jgi:hypothetical protein